VLLDESNEICSLLGLLETSEDHLGSGDVLLGIQQVSKQVLLVPLDTRLRVSLGVGVACDSSRWTANQTEQIGTLLVAFTLLDGVALGALGLEDLGSLGGITLGDVGRLSTLWSSRHVCNVYIYM